MDPSEIAVKDLFPLGSLILLPTRVPKMLEQLLIVTRGGLILWTCKELGNALRGLPMDTLIRSCLLEERSGAASYNYDAPGASYTLKWTFHNELGLVFVAVYQRILHLLYVDDLLAVVKKEFSEIDDPKRTSYPDFDDIFQQLKKEAEARAEDMKKSKQVVKPSNNNNNPGRKQDRNGNKSGKDGDDALDRPLENGSLRKNISNKVISSNGKEENGASNNGAFDVSKLQKRSKGGKKTEAIVGKVPKVELKKVAKKIGFGMIRLRRRSWITQMGLESMMDKEDIVSSDSESEEEMGKDGGPDGKKKGWFSSMFQSRCGSAGAAALILVSGAMAIKLGLNVIARIKGYADAAQTPELFTTAPAIAIPKAIANAGLKASDIDFYEINEAFSVVSLANQRLLNIDPVLRMGS
ncbi:signal recognition particle receptor alpha subunit family protein [Striga asiatica]|uniref:Signal recognition particle receptor alpha subunit family protein n=1 Tax=Striga asiatica TaxID=4170 RepID=A0A5A7QGX6_STRAF|nr:signal recognition particle receptor alpha subunit family protein [Striga asiatica]